MVDKRWDIFNALTNEHPMLKDIAHWMMPPLIEEALKNAGSPYNTDGTKRIEHPNNISPTKFNDPTSNIT
jgi:hypothetical protein